MPRPRAPRPPVHLRSARMLDVDKGEPIEPGGLLVDDARIVEVGPTSVPDDAVVIELGDLTLLPGLMDMEVNLLLGGPDHASPLNPVQDDPAVRTLRAVANAPADPAGRVHDRPQPRPLRADGPPAARRGAAQGDRPRVDRRPPGRPRRARHHPHRRPPRPHMFQAFAPHIMPLTVEEGIANGVSEVRKAVRYQIKHGAQLIKVCASGGVMSHTGHVAPRR